MAEPQHDFGTALHAAIEHSRLSLEEISQLLRKLDTPVSASTLSYWQNGDNQPERGRSLAAVTMLEKILDLPQGSLAGRIGPRKPRGRWVPRAGSSMSYDKLWQLPEALVRTLSKIDALPEDLDHPAKVSQHVSYRIDQARHVESVRVRRLIRGERDDTTRFVFVSRCGTLPQPTTVTFAQGCHPARYQADVPTATFAFEFLLNRPLRRGELATVEFALRFPPGQTDEQADIAVRVPTRDLALQVTFDPRCLPVRCHAYWQPRNTLPAQNMGDATLGGATHSFQYITLDPAPGQYGIKWKWA